MEKFIEESIKKLEQEINIMKHDIEILKNFDNQDLITKLETAIRTDTIYKRKYMETNLFKHFKSPIIQTKGTITIETNFLVISIKPLLIQIPLFLNKEIIIKDTRLNTFQNDLPILIFKKLYDTTVIEKEIEEIMLKLKNVKIDFNYLKNKNNYKKEIIKLEKQLSRYIKQNIERSKSNSDTYLILTTFMKEDQQFINEINQDLMYFKEHGYTINDKTQIDLEKYIKNRKEYFIEEKGN